MGRYEDLLEKAEGGDKSAFEDLVKEFSGGALRAKADEADSLRKQLDDSESLIIEAKFRRLVAEADLDVEISLEDLGDVTSSDLTLDFLREKAEAKSVTMKAVKVTIAKDAGFDSVEEYQQALDSMKEKRTAEMKAAEAIGGATASSSGGTPGPQEDVTPFDEATKDFKESKKLGATDDIALGEAAHTLMASQKPVPIDEV